MKIKRWIRDGNESFEKQGFDDTEDILCAAGRLLDDACSHEIVGEVLFEGEDGKFYAGTVEFVIAEADPDYTREVLDEDA